MDISEKINACYMGATNYPDLVGRLIEIGIESYTVDTSSNTILYRYGDGNTMIKHGKIAKRLVNVNFDEQKTIEAIRNNQQGKTDYPTFMNEIAESGVIFYEATLRGSNKRVTYIGTNGLYEEIIPI